MPGRGLAVLHSLPCPGPWPPFSALSAGASHRLVRVLRRLVSSGKKDNAVTTGVFVNSDIGFLIMQAHLHATLWKYNPFTTRSKNWRRLTDGDGQVLWANRRDWGLR
ncbi:hypothetical protein J6590_029249 [Homalodisca vitripennis]|nr:hypothetical protein J6590_029249 [Homalodisca vitripennis]